MALDSRYLPRRENGFGYGGNGGKGGGREVVPMIRNTTPNHPSDRQSSDGRVTHGLSNTSLYRVWAQMRSRCQYPNDRGFKYCGARGIEVWPAWDRDFKQFYEWAMQSGYEKGLSLERIRKDGNFEPANCKWSPRTAHNRNVRGAKLDLEKARAIRSSRKDGASAKALAAQYNISKRHIYDILANVRWKDNDAQGCQS